jgi:hypothetical protein
VVLDSKRLDTGGVEPLESWVSEEPLETPTSVLLDKGF